MLAREQVVEKKRREDAERQRLVDERRCSIYLL
jgi:hypothetical protein